MGRVSHHHLTRSVGGFGVMIVTMRPNIPKLGLYSRRQVLNFVHKYTQGTKKGPSARTLGKPHQEFLFAAPRGDCRMLRVRRNGITYETSTL